ncbi:MAG: isoprenylcysteine carboxylmethyltransferase family protein [Pseudomonadota bacterium]
MSKNPDNPGVILPPPVIYGLGMVAGLAINVVFPAHLGFPGGAGFWQTIGIVLLVASAGLAGWAIFSFHKAGTNVQPHHPATAIVTTGPYRRTRNPMYVALTLLYVGVSLVTDNPWILMGLIVILPVMTIGVVRREERYLSAKFGAEYDDYCSQVRRWL